MAYECKTKLKEMITVLNSNEHVKSMRADKRFTREELSKSVISDPDNTVWDDYRDVFSDNNQLDNLLTRGEYQPYIKSPWVWKTIHLTDVERHAVQMIMLVNDMKDTYTMMITEEE